MPLKFLLRTKKWWLVPVIILLALFAFSFAVSYFLPASEEPFRYLLF